MNAPLLSIVVPVYKTEATLPRCLDSLLAGNAGLPFEVIAVDDCSPDGCGAILADYAARFSMVRLAKTERNSGLCAVRNLGIDEARGEYVTFVDSDDELRVGAVREMCVLLSGHPVDLVKFQLVRVFPDGREVRRPHPSEPRTFNVKGGNAAEKRAAFRMFALSMMGGNSIFRRSKMTMRFSDEYLYSEDRVFGAEFYRAVETARMVPDEWYLYHQYDSGLSRGRTEKYVLQMLKTQRRLMELTVGLPDAPLCVPIARENLVGTLLDWYYRLTFHEAPETSEARSYYFETLADVLRRSREAASLPPVCRLLRFFAERRSRIGIALYRMPLLAKRRVRAFLGRVKRSLLKVIRP